jgi:hypothetical protein
MALLRTLLTAEVGLAGPSVGRRGYARHSDRPSDDRPRLLHALWDHDFVAAAQRGDSGRRARIAGLQRGTLEDWMHGPGIRRGKARVATWQERDDGFAAAIAFAVKGPA